jgi:hypothetical protein
VFTGERPPSIDSVRDRARALVGADDLDRALGDGWVEHQLDANIRLYRANSEFAGDGRMPQLVVGELMLHGAPGSLDELAQIVEQQRAKAAG